ncbi:hypothetical protein MTR67_051303 [Solanum verrucosum]|uniref:RNase H type-1 domain-containing protein n=1 Tax=Solanum verrucosum TaxID=315347 RepID=A0AAF1A200_SOLVR|nr:hypothetical protein MTR67_051303 [Solanum verrucosum]
MDSKWGWSTICLIAENYKPRITSIVVYWTRPQGNIWKLNTNGSFMPGQRLAGIGGIVRETNGKMVMTFAKFTQFSTNNSCELQEALHGIEWCHDN